MLKTAITLLIISAATFAGIITLAVAAAVHDWLRELKRKFYGPLF